MTLFDRPIDWESVYYTLVILYVSYTTVIFIIGQAKLFKHIKAIKNTPTPYEFMFRISYWFIPATIVVFAIPLSFIFNSSVQALIVVILMAAIVFSFFNIHLEIYQFEEDRIKRFGEDKDPIKASDVTGISIDSDEVNFHTAKFLNHTTFRSKRLSNKQWPEFIEAIEEFAQRNNLSVEHPERQA